VDQLKNLMDYTKFHIGVYLTLGTISVSLIETNAVEWWQLVPGLVLLFVAGAAGGVIASNIPEHEDWTSFSTKKEGLNALFGNYGSYKFWSKLEHASFWLAISLSTVLILVFDAHNKSGLWDCLTAAPT